MSINSSFLPLVGKLRFCASFLNCLTVKLSNRCRSVILLLSLTFQVSAGNLKNHVSHRSGFFEETMDRYPTSDVVKCLPVYS